MKTETKHGYTYAVGHPLHGAPDDYLSLLDIVDPMSCDDEGFELLIEEAATPEIEAFVHGLFDMRMAFEGRGVRCERRRPDEGSQA